MNKETRTFCEEKAKALRDSATCCAELREACDSFLKAIGTEKEQAMAAVLMAEIEEDIMPIEGLIGFAGSEAGAGYFGKEKAAEVLQHAEAIKAAGAKYCDCPACALCEELLSKKDDILSV